MRVQIFQALIITVCGFALSNCASLDAQAAISNSTNALAQAEQHEASKYARYSYTKAELMLQAAKIRNGYGEYGIAQQWAKQAQVLATEAKRTAKSRKNLEDQKKRIKRAVKTGSVPRTQKTPEKTNSPKTNKKTSVPPRKRRKLLPPPRPKRKLLPPKRPSGELP